MLENKFRTVRDLASSRPWLWN